MIYYWGEVYQGLVARVIYYRYYIASPPSYPPFRWPPRSIEGLCWLEDWQGRPPIDRLGWDRDISGHQAVMAEVFRLSAQG